MKYKKNIIKSLLLIIIFCKSASAFEIYNFIDNKKQTNSGFVLGLNKETLTILSLNGELKVIQKKNVTALYIYNIVHNPIKTLKLNIQMAKFLQNVYLTDSDVPSFTGFPIQMIDEMVIFYDLQGKIHVHVLSDIVKLRKYNFIKNEKISLTNFKKIILNTDSQVKQKSASRFLVYPTKIFKGKININKYFIKTNNNFIKISSYKERTFLYAKPMIFDQDFKMGNNFLFRKIRFKERNFMNPYVKWSNGSAYGFQSKTTIGKTDSEWIPVIFPMGILQSEVKTHFFNTLFVGNLNLAALPAGSRYYTSDEENLTYSNNLLYSYDPYVEINFNYMLLLGGDYGPFSASLGMFYPIYAINVNNHVREIAPPKTSPTFRFVYLKGKLKIKTIISITDYSSNSSSLKKNVFARYASEMQLIDVTEDGAVYQDSYGYSEYQDDDSSPVSKYSLKSYYLRIGFIYNIIKDFKVGLDGILVVGKYNETFDPQDIISGNNASYQNYNNEITFRHYNMGIYLHHRFSDYVALKAIFNYYYNTYDYDFFNLTGDKNLKKYEYGGAFELIF